MLMHPFGRGGPEKHLTSCQESLRVRSIIIDLQGHGLSLPRFKHSTFHHCTYVLDTKYYYLSFGLNVGCILFCLGLNTCSFSLFPTRT